VFINLSIKAFARKCTYIGGREKDEKEGRGKE